MKKTLILPKGYNKLIGWNWTLSKMLANSNMFNVKTKNFDYSIVKGTRNGNWSQMILDDAKIGLDTWDTYAPTSSYLDAGFFNSGIYRDLDLIVKIQYYNCTYWGDFIKNTKIPVKPWIVMPTRDFPLRCFQWENKKHKWITTVTGKNCRFGRQPWTDWCSNNQDFYYSGSYIVNNTLEDYISILKNCKWGMILKGKQRRHDGKNRRECEFTSCGIPLAMNYKPTYLFEMEPNKQFILINKPEDLAKLRDINPEPFAQASRQLYYDHFSDYGAAKTLIKIVEQL